MNVQCAICDQIEDIDINSFQAKRLMNRRISSYLCNNCHDRIAEKTNKRHETGNFHLYSSKNKDKRQSKRQK